MTARRAGKPALANEDFGAPAGALPRRFEAREVLGRGGMGVVLAAHDRFLGRVVALKLSRSERGRGAEHDARVAAEFALLAGLDHPGVVRALDLGRVPAEPGGAAGPSWWMSSEIVAGPRLDDWCRSAAADALERLVADLLGTLGWLHARGLVHGDLKPANVHVTTLAGAPWPVLLDFGLAGAFGGGAAHLGGTRSYLAPELAAGRPPSPASDLYALGVSLQPFAAASPALARLVAACLEAEPTRRPASARAAAEGAGLPSRGPRLGARDAATLWGDAVERAAAAAILPGVALVTLAGGDPLPFARAAAARLSVAGSGLWLVDASDGVAAWARLAGALGRPVVTPAADPSDQREVLDAFADAVVSALGRDGADDRLVVAGLERATPATRYVAARVLEARAFAGALLVAAGPLALDRGALDGARAVAVPPPDDEAVARFLDAHGVTAPAPDHTAISATLRAAAALGAGVLRSLFEGWHTAGVLAPAGDRWAFDGAAFARHGPARAGDHALFAALWAALPAAARAVATWLAHLGEASAELLAPLVAAREVVAEGLVTLGAAGLVVQRGADLALAPGLGAAIEAGAVAPEPDAERPARAAAALAAATQRSERQEHALGLLLAERAPAEAARAFERAADLAERGFDWARAGATRLRAARAHVAAEAFAAAFQAASRALVALRAAGGGPALDDALAVVEDAAARSGDARLVRAGRLARARAHLELGRPADALAVGDELVAEAAAWPPRDQAELRLVRGTALGRLNRRGEARAELDRALGHFEAANDRHAVGRVANNLGILAFHDGELDVAADAWARAAAAKDATGDRRGQRIGLSNRGLALRELGRFVDAWRAADHSLALATAIGDMVGRATGHLAKAQLALDLDLAERAAAELAGFDAVPWRPALVRGDGDNVHTRLLLARGERAAAAERARATAAQSHEPAVVAEALALAIVADPDAARALAPPSPEGLAGGLRTLVEAARAVAAARAGRWSEARPALLAVARRLAQAPGPPPAALPALPALADAAVMLDHDEAAALVAQAAADIARTRAEAVAALAFGTEAHNLRDAPDAARPSAPPMEAPDVTPSAEIVITLLTQLAGPTLPDDAARWAELLRGAALATRCELHAEGAAAVDAAPGKDTRPRFTDLADARRLPFEARDEAGALEALGLSLPHAEAALFWSWAPGGGPRDAAPLARAARVADLGLGLVRQRAANERLTGRMQALEAAHKDEVTSLREALEQSQSALELRYDYGGVVHRSPGMRRVLETLDKVTDRDLPVLVLGESGVGKELVARALHMNGPRKGRRFIAENCGAIPKDLFESTFFGHVKGAFTGALAPRQGLFEQADGGTLFLDEVGELPLEHQVKLLRVLQERKVRPVGGAREVPVDFRLVAATNRDLEQLVKEGRFREDLFYRLAVVRVTVPPLRERQEDVLAIADHLLETHGARLGRRPRLSTDAADRLQAHPWPGNVRELENEILRALALCDGDVIKARHLSHAVQRAGPAAPGDSAPRAGDARRGNGVEPLEVTLGRVEKEALVAALKHTGGQKAAAARLLGLSRPGLDAKLARHAIDARTLKRGPG